MKANKKNRSFATNNNAYTQIVSGIVALMLVIIISVLVFYNVYDSVDNFDSTKTETFSGYALKTQYLATFSVTLEDSPDGYSNCNISFYNGTKKNVVGYPGDAQKYYINNTRLTILGGCSSNQFSQINVTYTSKASSAASDSKTMAGTVFTLAPIIALVIVAGIILAVVLGFGGGKRGGL